MSLKKAQMSNNNISKVPINSGFAINEDSIFLMEKLLNAPKFNNESLDAKHNLYIANCLKELGKKLKAINISGLMRPSGILNDLSDKDIAARIIFQNDINILSSEIDGLIKLAKIGIDNSQQLLKSKEIIGFRQTKISVMIKAAEAILGNDNSQTLIRFKFKKTLEKVQTQAAENILICQQIGLFVFNLSLVCDKIIEAGESVFQEWKNAALNISNSSTAFSKLSPIAKDFINSNNRLIEKLS